MLVFRGGIHHGTGDGMIHVTMSGTPQGLKQTSTQTLKELFKGYLQRFTNIYIYIIYKILIIDQYNIHLFIYLYMQYIIDISFFFRKRKKKKHVSTSPISNRHKKSTCDTCDLRKFPFSILKAQKAKVLVFPKIGLPLKRMVYNGKPY